MSPALYVLEALIASVLMAAGLVAIVSALVRGHRRRRHTQAVTVDPLDSGRPYAFTFGDGRWYWRCPHCTGSGSCIDADNAEFSVRDHTEQCTP